MNKVDIIPGHGLPDPGSVNSTNGVKESDGNLGVGLKLKNLLELNGITGNMSRTTENAIWGATNTKDDVNWQIQFANESDADIAIAIHFNSSTNKSAKGTEVLFSQYPSYDENELRLANLVLNELIFATGLSNRGVKQIDSGIGVIKKVYKPTILVENAFVSNDDEVIWCSDESHQWILAKAITKGVCKYFGVEYKDNIEEEEDMVRYNKLSDIPNEWKFRDIIEILMNAKIINGDGSDKYGNDDVINLSHDQVRSLIFIYNGGGFDKKLIAEGLEPAVDI